MFRYYVPESLLNFTQRYLCPQLNKMTHIYFLGFNRDFFPLLITFQKHFTYITQIPLFKFNEKIAQNKF